jgi:hypothetical protein
MAIESEAIRQGTEGTALERVFNRHVGNFVHVFLSVLAVLVMVAASVSLVEIVRYDFPKLWASSNEYQTLHVILQSILLLAIAGELALLLLYHRTSAAVEVAMFVIARRMVATDATAFDLLLGSIAIAILLVVRFYFLPGKPK